MFDFDSVALNMYASTGVHIRISYRCLTDLLTEAPDRPAGASFFHLASDARLANARRSSSVSAVIRFFLPTLAASLTALYRLRVFPVVYAVLNLTFGNIPDQPR